VLVTARDNCGRLRLRASGSRACRSGGAEHRDGEAD
jgi:hypothetical protein